MPAEQQHQDFVEQLRQETAGVRLVRHRPGIQRALSRPQHEQAAATFNANASRLRSSKRLIDTSNKAYRDCSKVVSRAVHYWKLQTIDYPIAGVRLIRRELINTFDAQMQAYRQELGQAVEKLRAAYDDIKAEARAQLGDLYSEADYPEDLAGEFGIAWEFPSVEPPDHLKELNPALYQQQQRLIAERLELALHAAEQELAAELQQLVGSLAEKLRPGEDGKEKRLTKKGIDAFGTFFERFKALKITSNAELNALVDQAERMVAGIDLEAVKNPESVFRPALAEQLQTVAAGLDELIVEKPTREFFFDDEEPAEAEPAEAAS